MMNLNKNFWSKRYLENQIGWDVGKITTPLKEYIDQIKDKNIKILIPGAGNSYEAEYLFNNGFKNIYVIDLVKAPLENLLKRVPNFTSKNLLQGDFFELEKSFDLILEQTFFCALNPNLRKQYVEKTYELLKPKGKIVGLYFNFPLTQEGPPFGGSKEEYLSIFSDKFDIKVLEKCNNSIIPRNGKELFAIFEKK